MLPKALKSSPWRRVEHGGEAYLVREQNGAVWACRLSDREVWLWEGDEAPAWTRASTMPDQRSLFDQGP